jgi:hypothetical protein
MFQASAEKLKEASELRRGGMGWSTIVARTGISIFILKSNLEPGFLERHRIADKVSRARRRNGFAPRSLLKKRDMIRMSDPGGANPFGHYAIGDRVFPVAVPTDAADERDRAMAYEHPTLTAHIMGDPPPWRSALGKRK